ncbi:Acetylglutamate kinase [Anaerobiospirillum thomasii]|uniref:acetylglutamate kinase n=1 Tax=Anaerobiospirillum thomasii TaxID=179995 RepID=UPI000D967C76|nr:acetylglutamate kinase [Anaerobiospirillum thomasii]SPT71675.1 Acetylglutamate kinase [Anaerobiospirillum thomasii]
MTTPLVIKLSGKALKDKDKLSTLFEAFDSLDKNIVIVHGGGVEVDALLEALDFKTTRLDGLRVSPKEQMPYISAALCGMCNKELQSMLIAKGHRALGLLATDGNTTKACVLDEKYGCVGTVSAGSDEFLHSLFAMNIIPVISSIGIDDKGTLLNINADDVALSVAALLHAPLVYLSDVAGVLDLAGNLIESIDTKKACELIAQGIITDGMAVKVKAALKASTLTGAKIFIASYSDPELKASLKSLRRLGTSIYA